MLKCLNELMPEPEQWGYTSDESQIKYTANGMGNVYDKNQEVNTGPEYITVYDSDGSLKSRIISVLVILAVIGFCGLLFTFIFKDKGDSSGNTLQAQGKSNVKN